MSANHKIIRPLFGIIFLDQTYLTITFPLITLLFFDTQSRLFAAEVSMQVRSMWFGTCVALPNLLNLFFSPLLSAASDELGRKKILLIEIFSAFLFTFTVGIAVYIGNLLLIFLGFAIKGAFARINPTALAMIGDASSKDKKILLMGYLQFAIAVGAALGPVIGGYFAKRYYFATLNFSLPFFIAAMLALINTFLAYHFIHETHTAEPNNRWQQFNLKSFKEIFTDPNVVRISLLLFLIQSSWSMYYQLIPPTLKRLYQFDSHQLGLFIGMIAFWLALTTGIGIKFCQRFLRLRQILLFAVYLILAGLFLTYLACDQLLPYSEPFIWLGALPVAAGDVIAYSCLTALYSSSVSPKQQGKVMGIALFIVSLTWAATGFFGGLLLSHSPLLPLILAPTGVITCVLLIHADFGRKLMLSFERTD